ncbi:hypothetical protein HELRODRAFT_189885 [Helobdella robusta]|uniref:Uncharacterized protein n=1 Tax=Helobdella robusta TaxID=6412 RepID=T1FRG3_HELRO|nr:hypothetical protein HELRODRAFT_189885 [Helobdella robusta]ESN90531.1 hypothetical protein HELRODRAFT_189885 [Helobdella robusta]
MKVKDHGEPSLSSYTDVKIIISDKILTNQHLLNGGSLFGFNTAAELLADETVAIALAVLLAVILVLISIFTLVIWLFGVGRKRRLESYNGHERKNVKYKNKKNKAEDCQQATVTSLSANGRAETTVAHSSSIEKELKMDLTNVLTDDAKTTSNHQVLNMSEACAKPVVMFVKDQHNYPDVNHRENKNGNKDKFFKINWINKTPSSDVDDKRMKNHVVNTDWYMNPIVNAADSTLSRPDKAQHYQSDLIEFNSGFSNFSLLKPFLLNENFSSPKYLPQNREFEQWLDDI